MPRSFRKPADLSDSLHQQLNMYALAATAAGVGVLALAHPAEAEIIYTPAHRHVLLKHRLRLDLNHDGLTDFFLRRFSSVATSTGYRHFSITGDLATRGPSGYGIVGYRGNSTSVTLAALHAGVQIGSSKQSFSFWYSGLMAERIRPVGGHTWQCYGKWNDVRKRYLGLEFKIKGVTHYGWARLNESCNQKGKRGAGAEALLTGYAYETIPNKPIIAGKTKGPDVVTLEPGSLGALAKGAGVKR